MNKFKIFLSLTVLIFAATLSANTAFASETFFDNINSEKIVDITVKNSKQPHVIWSLTGDDAAEMLTLLNLAKLSEGTARQCAEKTEIHVNTQNHIVSISVYDNGSFIVDENKEYIVENFDVFKSGIDVLLSTQSKGYGNVMPSKGELVKISDWAEKSYQLAIYNNILPEYMKTGYMTDDITREQFCDVISNLLQTQTKQDAVNNKKSKFKDTKTRM